ncbi:alpha/beta fold hydrolase [Micromonospora sp. NPDC004336]
MASQKALSGDHWKDWLSVRCPTLLIRGTRSDELAGDHAREMIARRAGRAQLVELPAGHVVHHDAPAQFAAAVGAFLSEPGGGLRPGSGSASEASSTGRAEPFPVTARESS